MKKVHSLEYKASSKEELLPGYEGRFPYIATRAELHKYPEAIVPWHWHKPVELFYMESGRLEYNTTEGKTLFPQGWGGFVNSNVLHSTSFDLQGGQVVQLLHIFDPALISGDKAWQMDEKYVLPLIAAGPEIVPLSPDIPEEAQILQNILKAFEIKEDEWGYEFKLREALTEIWLRLLALPCTSAKSLRSNDDTIKQLMVYIHEHYAERISVEALALSAHISKRACYRIFREKLHMSPLEYIRNYRLQMACLLLRNTELTVTETAYACGLGSASYFGKLFRESIGCSPVQFRSVWHDRDNTWQN